MARSLHFKELTGKEIIRSPKILQGLWQQQPTISSTKGERKMRNYFKRLLQKKEGFTLVELLIVIAIIAILAAIAIPQFTKYKQRAYDSELASDAKNAYTASIAYLTDFPADTIDTLIMLRAAGYTKSSNIIFANGDMTTTSGNVTLISTAALDTINTAVIMFNGNIEIQPTPL